MVSGIDGLKAGLEKTLKEKVNLMVLKLFPTSNKHGKVLVNFIKSMKH